MAGATFYLSDVLRLILSCTYTFLKQRQPEPLSLAKYHSDHFLNASLLAYQPLQNLCYWLCQYLAKLNHVFSIKATLLKS
jgi:hypothetical protein